ncbi:MAG: hypothetical protein KH366_17825 [Clostridiaceae bacterium]|nr:hypothetical protein [Clostridiaceae bacterium]
MAKYNDLPLTNFPDTEDTWARMQDITVNLITVAQQYNALWESGDVTGANTLLENNPGLINAIFNADKWNKLRDAIISLERFYLNDVQTFIDRVAQYTIGIKDDAAGDEKITNTYSANKIDRLTGYYSNSFDIVVSDWTSDFIYTHEDDSIGEDDIVEVYFNSDSYTAVSKAQIRVMSGSGAGNFKLKAKKVPIGTITIDFYKVVKKNG